MTAASHFEIRLKVTPNAGRNEVTGFNGGVLQLKIAAPPVAGKANRELTAFLSRTLGVSKSSLKIVKGQTGRHKVVAVDGLTLEDFLSRLGC